MEPERTGRPDERCTVALAPGRQGDPVTRHGGEESVVVLAGCGAPEMLRSAAARRDRVIHG